MRQRRQHRINRVRHYIHACRYALSLEDALASLGAAVKAILAAPNVLAQPIVPMEQVLTTETEAGNDHDDDSDDSDDEEEHEDD